MKRHILGALSACALLAASLPFSQAMANSTIVPGHENSTLTVYDVASGDTTFTWDLDSDFSVTGTEVIVKSNDILFGNDPKLPIVVGTVYEFAVPNFFDPLPKKFIMVEMSGANPTASSSDIARVLDIIGADSDFNIPAPAVPVDAVFISGVSGPTEAVEFWEMSPNPDFEIIKIFAPTGFELESITITTQSTVVPIPTAVWLFGSGLLGLVGVARRNTAV